jgi:hypothetical protein
MMPVSPDLSAPATEHLSIVPTVPAKSRRLLSSGNMLFVAVRKFQDLHQPRCLPCERARYREPTGVGISSQWDKSMLLKPTARNPSGLELQMLSLVAYLTELVGGGFVTNATLHCLRHLCKQLCGDHFKRVCKHARFAGCWPFVLAAASAECLLLHCYIVLDSASMTVVYPFHAFMHKHQRSKHGQTHQKKWHHRSKHGQTHTGQWL